MDRSFSTVMALVLLGLAAFAMPAEAKHYTICKYVSPGVYKKTNVSPKVRIAETDVYAPSCSTKTVVTGNCEAELDIDCKVVKQLSCRSEACRTARCVWPGRSTTCKNRPECRFASAVCMRSDATNGSACSVNGNSNSVCSQGKCRSGKCQVDIEEGTECFTAQNPLCSVTSACSANGTCEIVSTSEGSPCGRDDGNEAAQPGYDYVCNREGACWQTRPRSNSFAPWEPSSAFPPQMTLGGTPSPVEYMDCSDGEGYPLNDNARCSACSYMCTGSGLADGDYCRFNVCACQLGDCVYYRF